MFCVDCGERLLPTNKFCGNCGAAVCKRNDVKDKPSSTGTLSPWAKDQDNDLATFHVQYSPSPKGKEKVNLSEESPQKPKVHNLLDSSEDDFEVPTKKKMETSPQSPRSSTPLCGTSSKMEVDNAELPILHSSHSKRKKRTKLTCPDQSPYFAVDDTFTGFGDVLI